MVNFGPLAAEIGLPVWGTPANFNKFRVLAALLYSTRVGGVSQTLRRWTEGATYIWQVGHHVAHRPTSLVCVCNFVKNQRILTQFSLLDLTMNDTYDFYELHPPHLTDVATLSCESQNSENVILQWDITKENTIKYIVYALLKWTCRI